MRLGQRDWWLYIATSTSELYRISVVSKYGLVTDCVVPARRTQAQPAAGLWKRRPAPGRRRLARSRAGGGAAAPFPEDTVAREAGWQGYGRVKAEFRFGDNFVNQKALVFPGSPR
jgi:hypothetical protein